MVLFETIKRHFRAIGYLDVNSSSSAWNGFFKIFRNIFVISLSIFGNLLLLWFMIFKAKHFEEFTEAFPFFGDFYLIFGGYLVLIWQKSKILRLIDDLENIIEKRE